MSSRSITRKVSTLVLLVLLASGLLPVVADEHSIIEEIHDKLHQALNPGGDTPSSADQTALLQAALKELKDLPTWYRDHRHRYAAIFDIKAALHDLAEGDPNNQAHNDIRQADAEVRDME